MRDRVVPDPPSPGLTAEVPAPDPTSTSRERVGWPALLVLASLAAVAPIATDLYLPGFPALGDELGLSAQRRAAHPHGVPRGDGRRPARHGTPVRPVGRRPPLVASAVGLRPRRRGERAGAVPARAPRRPVPAGLRRRRWHGHRPRRHRRPRDRTGRGQGADADAHGRWRGPGARPPGRRPALRPGGVARHPVDGHRTLPGHARRRRRGAAGVAAARRADGVRHVLAAVRRVGARPRRSCHRSAVFALAFGDDDGLHLGLAVRLPQRGRAVRGGLRPRLRRQRRSASSPPGGCPAGSSTAWSRPHRAGLRRVQVAAALSFVLLAATGRRPGPCRSPILVAVAAQRRHPGQLRRHRHGPRPRRRRHRQRAPRLLAVRPRAPSCPRSSGSAGSRPPSCRRSS